MTSRARVLQREQTLARTGVWQESHHQSILRRSDGERIGGTFCRYFHKYPQVAAFLFCLTKSSMDHRTGRVNLVLIPINHVKIVLGIATNSIVYVP
jgi:hypothetical protein